jgi:hypothetical protein
VLTGVALVTVSAAAAVLAARVSFGADGWLWNLDMPKIHYPLAVFFHDALRHGQLPLWENDLGLGFPLYAEGQIGAFYPPNWLIFQLEPLVAIDVTRLLHLTMTGVGVGVLSLRVAGSRAGALVAAVVVVLCGATVTKLEWWNLTASFAWLPWVLLPLSARRPPRRTEVLAAGLVWGIQAFAGHPQTWLLTGLAAVVLLARQPWLPSLGRMAVFGGIGVALGAAQLIPTYLLLGISDRAGGLPANELFGNAWTVFDVLGLGFANAFLQTSGGDWDYATSWYPDGHFPLLNAGLYVGLPALALAGAGAPTRRARRWLALAVLMALIPVIAAFQPAFWQDAPVLNGLRSPVRSYMVVSVAIGVLAAVGVSRMGRHPASWRWGLLVMGGVVGAYVVATALARFAPAVFDWLTILSWWQVGPDAVDGIRGHAIAALSTPWPMLLELGLGLGAAILISRPRSPAAPFMAVLLAAAPLALLSPGVNPLRPEAEFSGAGSSFVTTLRAERAHRVLTLGAPAFYPGMPDQLAAAGVPDIAMFSSLNIHAVDDLVQSLRAEDPAGPLRRAVGIDRVVTFEASCSGRLMAIDRSQRAYVCSVDGTTSPPYWIPEALASIPANEASTDAIHVDLDAEAVVDAAQSVRTIDRSELRHHVTLEAPAPGWVFFDSAWWPGWQVTLDGEEARQYEALGGRLVPVPAGSHTLVSELTLWEVRLGAMIGALGLVVGVAWALWPRRPSARVGAPTEAGGGIPGPSGWYRPP